MMGRSTAEGRREGSGGDRPETSVAQGQRLPPASPKDSLCQKHLNLEKSIRKAGPGH